MNSYVYEYMNPYIYEMNIYLYLYIYISFSDTFSEICTLSRLISLGLELGNKKSVVRNADEKAFRKDDREYNGPQVN